MEAIFCSIETNNKVFKEKKIKINAKNYGLAIQMLVMLILPVCKFDSILISNAYFIWKRE